MFIVTVLSLLLLLYVGYGEGRRTYEQIELEKLTAQGFLIQNTIEKFLRDDLPLKQFPGFATIARPLVDGLAERYPTLQVDMPRLSTELSYELGLSWRMDLVDARGVLAIIFADLDGIVTVVDQDQSQD